MVLLTQETVVFLLSSFNIFRQDHGFQARKEAGLLQQVFFKSFAKSSHIYSTLVFTILLELMHKGVTLKSEFCHRPVHLTKEK